MVCCGGGGGGRVGLERDELGDVKMQHLRMGWDGPMKEKTLTNNHNFTQCTEKEILYWIYWLNMLK